jgi:glycosyltransferase involved in cell wall biosynthesis
MRADAAVSAGKRSLIIIIPARNEEATVGGVVQELKARVDAEIVVISDASTDGTRRAALAAGATVLPVAVQIGAWGAVRTGLRYALKRGAARAITMDADGQHPADSIPLILKPIEAGDADIVIGACPQRGSRARKLAWGFFRQVTRLKVHDLTSGFRAYNRSAITALVSEDTVLLDYQDIGVLLYLRKRGLRIAEAPVAMCPRIAGHSKVFSTWWTVLKYLIYTGVLCLARRH